MFDHLLKIVERF